MDAKLTGELIARRRRELGLSQTELAERLLDAEGNPLEAAFEGAAKPLDGE